MTIVHNLFINHYYTISYLIILDYDNYSYGVNLF